MQAFLTTRYYPLPESLPVLPFVTPFVTYSFGEAGDLNHNAITGGIGLTITGNGK